MREITLIVVHCSDTPNGSDKYATRDIDAWHAARGFRRDETCISTFNQAHPYIGYHEVVDVFGRMHSGRGDNEPGEHATGHNTYSLSVCLMGKDRFTSEQWEALKWIVGDWRKRYGDIRVIGHRDVNGHKLCPGFSVAEWSAGGMVPLAEHLL